MSFVTGSVAELLYASTAVGATLSTFTSEAQLNTTGTMGVQAHLPVDFWLPNQTQVGRGIKIVARGILSSTGTPTFTVTVRGGASGSTSAAILAGTAAMTTGSGVTNQIWELEADVLLTTVGAAGTNSTVRGIGTLISPGLATTINAVYGGAASPGTVATLDTSVANYINVNAACGTSNASNSITLQQLLVYGLN